MENYDPKILIATDIGMDGDSIKELLEEEFFNVHVSKNRDTYIEDFEKIRPAALMLAFKTLERAEEYYLGLYRESLKVHMIPHRTLLLCHKEEVPEAYELCRKRSFDDYVLFWPMAQDGLRLRMAVHHAIHYMATAEGATAAEIASQARRIAGLESLLENTMSKVGGHIDVASQSISKLERDLNTRIDGLIRKVEQAQRELEAAKAGNNPDAPPPTKVDVSEELREIKAEGAKQFRQVKRDVEPLKEWEGEFKKTAKPKMENFKRLNELAADVPPTLMVVEDEEFQHKIIAHMLSGMGIVTKFCTSGSQALLALRTFRPDLILMDIGLPDGSGIQVTSQIKAVKKHRNIPVVMMTAHTEKDSVIRSLKAGASDYLVKPLNRDRFMEKINKYVLGV